MGNKPILFDFSGVYRAENLAGLLGGDRVDCSAIEGTSCYCDPEAEEVLATLLREVPTDTVHWLDSGDYHYLSRLTTDRIAEPFDLVVFDHHTDMQEPAFGDILSCGGWVRSALRRNPFLHHVLLVGVAPELAAECDRSGGRVTVVDRTALPAPEVLPRLLRDHLPIYLSIDKDVLHPDFARTDWDQGTMTLPALEAFVEALADSRPLMGADMCGEIPACKGGTERDFLHNASTNIRLNRLLLSKIRLSL